MRSKEAIILAVVVLLLFAAGCAGCGVRNSLVEAEEEVNSAWANVEAAYQRRADLIPNLVRTVERAESFDRDALAALEEARQKASSVTAPGSGGALSDYGEAQAALGASLGAALDQLGSASGLRSVEAFRDLQDQIEGSENRITFARRDYNAAVSEYNARVRRFPTSIVAALTGFDTRAQFEAEAGADSPPRVE